MRDLPTSPRLDDDEGRDVGAIRPRRRRRRLRWPGVSPSSSLLRRIVFINLIGLGLMVGGVLYLNQFRAGLIDLRAEALATQGEIIAVALAQASAAEGRPDGIAPIVAERGLRVLAQPVGVRARLFDQTGRLIADTRAFHAAPVTVTPLPARSLLPPQGVTDWLMDRYDAAFGPRKPLYTETEVRGITTQPEVYDALRGERVIGEHVNAAGELIVAVSLPVQRFKVVQGALVLSTEGGDIDAIVRAEREAILRVFLVALGVSVLLSALLAAAIARPLRRLAAAARGATSADSGLRFTASLRFPDLTRRRDEIGALSGALREMSAALDQRIEGVERFAADVAHEIKNPLTSLRSAVETLRRAGPAEDRARLLAVIEQDVRRLDRLVTDISNASRLDAELAREAFSEIDMGALLRTVADVIGDARVRLRLTRPPILCRGLEGRLAQVFINLVDNALSFSPPEGQVHVIASRLADGGVRVCVEDDGPGIADDKLEAVFERFYSDRPVESGDAAAALSGDGHSGLGLSIAKLIVQAHDGRIWAENRLDPAGLRRGARFVVQLPGGDGAGA